MALYIQLAIVNGTRGKRETEDSGLNMQPPRTKHILDRMTVSAHVSVGKPGDSIPLLLVTYKEWQQDTTQNKPTNQPSKNLEKDLRGVF